MNFRENINGQSLIEVLFAVGIVGTVIVGVAILMTNTLSTKRRVLDRSDAVKLAENAMEDLTILKKNDSGIFWAGGLATDCSDGNFDCSYSFTPSPQTCPVGETCVEVAVEVSWDDKTRQTVSLTRFFYKD